MALVGSAIATGTPSSASVPPTGGSTPNSAWATSDRPAPTRPAIPRISPCPTVKDTACCGYRCVRRPVTLKAARPSLGGEDFGSLSMSRPTISLMIASCVSCSRASCPALAPSRSTTARSATTGVSPRRCVM
jgi:hypothetical protein